VLTAHVPVPTNLSRAMSRVAEALRRHAPSRVRFVERPAAADVALLHVIGPDALSYRSPARATVAMQYCYKTAGGTRDEWREWWGRQGAVMSYYDLSADVPAGTPFVHAPLGVDRSVFFERRGRARAQLVTSGYVSAPGAEAIREAAEAAAMCGVPTFHLGPRLPEGMQAAPAGWRSGLGIPDDALAREYSAALWVSGLRHVEGFEMPAAEGLMCGARPVMFDRPEARAWFGEHAVFVPECSGAELVGALAEVFSRPPEPVDAAERRAAAARFDWAAIAARFWEAAIGAAVREGAAA
jgi:hypothetical protein